MKVRTGFVSNSSSSSFVLIGHRIPAGEAKKALEDGKKVYFQLQGAGTSGSCEDWGLFLDFASFDILTKSSWYKREKRYIKPEYFIAVTDKYYANDEEGLVIKEPIEGECIFSLTRDYSSPENIEELRHFIATGRRFE